jgi:hypothetical protein
MSMSAGALRTRHAASWHANLSRGKPSRASKQPDFTGSGHELLTLQTLAGNKAVSSAIGEAKSGGGGRSVLPLQRQGLLPVQGLFNPFSKYRGLTEQQKATWKSANLDPKAAKSVYKSDGGVLNEVPQESTIRDLSKNAAGQSFLKRMGYWSWSRVVGYLPNFSENRSFSNWEKLGTLPKFQIASRVWHITGGGSKAGETAYYRKTPAFMKALALNGRKEEIYKHDAETWSKTLQSPAPSLGGDQMAAQAAAAIDIVRRIFLVLQTRLRYTKDGLDFEEWKGPVAAALSHGGRVNIRIPKAAEPGKEHEFFNWLFGTDAKRFATRRQRLWNFFSGKSRAPEASGLHRRAAGTHHIKISSSGAMKEERGKGAFFKALRDKRYVHLGMDLPVGGFGEKDVNGDVILPDGRNGHLYIGYLAPTTEKDGALLIGCEGDAPGKTNPLGHHHDFRAISEEMSAVGAPKTAAMTKMKAGGMVVDLTAHAAEDPKWFANIQEMERHVSDGKEATRNALVGSRLDLSQALRESNMLWEIDLAG